MSYPAYLKKESRLCAECGAGFQATVGGWKDRSGHPRKFCSKRCACAAGIRTHLAQIKSAGKWKGGSRYVAIAFSAYPHECSHCGSKERLHVHHKDHNRLNEAVENLTILCKPCHHRHHSTKREPFCKHGHPRTPGTRCKTCAKGWNQAQWAKRKALRAV